MYTINGWLKGVNANTLVPTNDIGKDGTPEANSSYISTRAGLHSTVGRDAFGYVLGYYWNSGTSTTDWEPINTPAQSLYADSYTLTATGDDLYNGNIKEMSTALMKPNGSGGPARMTVIFNRYEYDQLNRIKTATSFTSGTNLDTYIGNSAAASEYLNTFNYDANGNIMNQVRNGNATAGTSMDDLGYNYYANTNQLEYVTDGGTSGNYDDDLETQGSGNYTYSAIGELEHDASEGIDLITWDINGKIHSIQRTPGWSIPGSSPTAYPSDLEFKYDAMGNRICKIEKPRDYAGILNEDTWVYTYYVRDASGNVMAVYTRDLYQAGSNYTDEMRIKETHVYGGSRLGIRDYTAQAGITASVTYAFSGYVSSGDDDNGKFNTGAQVTNTAMPHPSSTAQTRTRGRKVYELTNHLGNVLVTFYDRKISKDGNADNITDYYLADVNTTSDYSAFGAPMPGRMASANDYRFGMNGQEKDDEVNGKTGTSYTAEYWQYDSRLGRRWNIDPMSNTSWSPYSVLFCNPALFADILGDTPTVREAAIMAQHVYGPDKETGYQPTLIGRWEVAPASDLPKDIILENDKTGFKSQLYRRKLEDGTFEYNYVFAGTEDVKKDGGADLDQAFGLAQQYDMAIDNAQKLDKFLGSNELTFSGHSLGGGMAQAAVMATGRYGMTFNPAWLSLSTMERYDLDPTNGTVDNYVVFGDPLNVGQWETFPVATVVPLGNTHYLTGATVGFMDRHSIATVIAILPSNGYTRIGTISHKPVLNNVTQTAGSITPTLNHAGVTPQLKNGCSVGKWKK